ncbi:MAG TPA: chromosome segregation protein SMC [Anaerolineaceae bacterium]
MTPWLKSLELHGYKTFASRNQFEFPGSITAIVGPNGSGKSNIADAIRWVLGEQSYSLLRARKTEDMIYSGSEQRSRAGMASAMITFNNESGFLPIDYSEVSITRRAYRDGQNEYLLNGQRVRLKEITELLAQSGLSERTYTIIGQGLIDTALSLKPEERRKFFEEAAGIGLYRSRREDSVNRLATTQRNLERVLDILSELEPRLQSLEKQAKRVAEYERIRADLRILLRDWYGYHWHQLQTDLLHARESLKAQESQLEKARARLQVEQTRVDRLRANLTSLREQLNQWHTESAGLHTRREKVSKELAVLDERQRSLTEQQHSVESDLTSLEEQLKTRRQRYQEAQDRLTDLKEEYREATTQLENARKNYQTRQQERERQEFVLREARRSLSALETRQVQGRAHKKELELRLETLQKNQEALSQSLLASDLGLKDAQANLEAKGKERESVEAERSRLQDEMSAQRKRLAELESHRRRLLDERTKIESQRTRVATELDVLEQAERSLSGVGGGARSFLNDARQGKIAGKFHLLSSQLIVSSEYEVAVAALLGDMLDGVVVENPDLLESLLVYMDSGDKGRAVFLPIPDMTRPTAVRQNPAPDVIGRAADLVRCPEHVKPVVEALLGDCWIVRDRRVGIRMASSCEPGQRLVTLKGEVFHGNGVVAAGKENRTGAISRPRRKEELQQLLAEVNKDSEESTQAIKEIEGRLAAEREKESSLERSFQEISQRASRIQQEHQRLALNFDQVKQKREFQVQQLKTVENQLERTRQEIAASTEELSRIEKQVFDGNEKVRQSSRALNGLPLEEFQTQIVQWNANWAAAGRAVREGQTRLDELAENIRINEQQQTLLSQRKVDIEKEHISLTSRRDELFRTEGDLNKEIEALQEKITPTEIELASCENENRKAQDDLLVVQQVVTVAERHTTQAQMEVGRCRDALESIRRKIEDDLGLVALEYNGDVAGPTPLPLDGMVEQLPRVSQIPPELEENITRQRAMLRRLGSVNPEVQNEYRTVKERYEFLKQQVDDLRRADTDLRVVIAELDELMRREFSKTFRAVAEEFRQNFTRLFGGGSARLVLLNEDNPTESGVDIEARLPGRREQGLSLLSGGERSLTACALIFSLLKVAPTPFCVLDEVDAMLDEANVGRFRDMLAELSGKTQFIVITHNRNTVQVADVIYGITMGRDGASQVISLKLDEINDEIIGQRT